MDTPLSPDEQLLRDNRGFKKANGALKYRNARLHEKNSALLVDNAALRKQVKALERHNARLRIASDDLRKQLHAIPELGERLEICERLETYLAELVNPLVDAQACLNWRDNNDGDE